MIDIHAHILPGIDDGSGGIKDTLQMLRTAAASGVTGIVATPHCNVPDSFANYFDSLFLELFDFVSQQIVEEGIPIDLMAGMEVFVTPQVPDLLMTGKLVTLNQSDYLLVEFDVEETPEFMWTMLTELAQIGVIPVVAHPERYLIIQDRPWLVRHWLESGFGVQINKGSFQGRFGYREQATAHRLLQHRMVTVIASDAHTPYQRTTWLTDVYEELAEEYDEAYLDVLFAENPRRICAGEPLIEAEMIPFFKRKDWME